LKKLLPILLVALLTPCFAYSLETVYATQDTAFYITGEDASSYANARNSSGDGVGILGGLISGYSHGGIYYNGISFATFNLEPYAGQSLDITSCGLHCYVTASYEDAAYNAVWVSSFITSTGAGAYTQFHGHSGGTGAHTPTYYTDEISSANISNEQSLDFTGTQAFCDSLTYYANNGGYFKICLLTDGIIDPSYPSGTGWSQIRVSEVPDSLYITFEYSSGWGGTINGVSSPASVNGVTEINSINGVE